MEGLLSEDVSLIFDVLVSMGSYLMPVTMIIVGKIHNNLYLIYTDKVLTEYT